MHINRYRMVQKFFPSKTRNQYSRSVTFTWISAPDHCTIRAWEIWYTTRICNFLTFKKQNMFIHSHGPILNFTCFFFFFRAFSSHSCSCWITWNQSLEPVTALPGRAGFFAGETRWNTEIFLLKIVNPYVWLILSTNIPLVPSCNTNNLATLKESVLTLSSSMMVPLDWSWQGNRIDNSPPSWGVFL